MNENQDTDMEYLEMTFDEFMRVFSEDEDIKNVVRACNARSPQVSEPEVQS
jgi:hypothetical protein